LASAPSWRHFTRLAIGRIAVVTPQRKEDDRATFVYIAMEFTRGDMKWIMDESGFRKDRSEARAVVVLGAPIGRR